MVAHHRTRSTRRNQSLQSITDGQAAWLSRGGGRLRQVPAKRTNTGTRFGSNPADDRRRPLRREKAMRRLFSVVVGWAKFAIIVMAFGWAGPICAATQEPDRAGPRFEDGQAQVVPAFEDPERVDPARPVGRDRVRLRRRRQARSHARRRHAAEADRHRGAEGARSSTRRARTSRAPARPPSSTSGTPSRSSAPRPPVARASARRSRTAAAGR